MPLYGCTETAKQRAVFWVLSSAHEFPTFRDPGRKHSTGGWVRVGLVPLVQRLSYNEEERERDEREQRASVRLGKKGVSVSRT